MYNTIGQGADNSGGFVGDWYWSSTENAPYTSWAINFSDGTANNYNKLNVKVRVIRAF